jgi:tetratricopeptide (TPR) repeat protein
MSVAEKLPPMSEDSPLMRRSAASANTTRRTLNLPFLIASAGVFLIAGVALYVVHRWQVGRTSTAFLKRADQLEAEKRWFDASDYIRHYLRLRPDAQEQWIRLAKVYDQGVTTPAQRAQSIEYHYRAIGTGIAEAQTPLRKRLGSLLLENERYLEAITVAEELLGSHREDAEGLRLKALGLWGQWRIGGSTAGSEAASNRRTPETPHGSVASAASNEKTAYASGTNNVIFALQEAIAHNGGDLDLTVALATAYRDMRLKAFLLEHRNKLISAVEELSETERIRTADSLMLRFTSGRSQDSKELLAAYHYQKRWDISGYEDNLEEALRVSPDDPETLLASADHAYQQARQAKAADKSGDEAKRLLELARQRYQRLIGLQPNSPAPDARLRLGEVLAAMEQTDEAVKAWTEGLEGFKNSPVAVEFHARLAGHWIERGQLENAAAWLDAVDQAIAKFPPGISRESVLAVEQEQDLRRGLWYIKRGEPGEAIAPLRRVVVRQEQLGTESETGLRALLILGNAYASLSDWTAAAEAYDRAATQQPDLAAAHLAASSCWLSANGVEQAVERADRALQLQPSCTAWYALATALYRQQMLLPLADRSWLRLEQAIANARNARDDATLEEPWRIDMLQAEVTLSRGSEANADLLRQITIQDLRKAELNYPEARALLAAIPLMYQRLGAGEEADRSLLELQNSSENSEQAKVAAARLHVMRGEFPKAEELLRGLQSTTVDPAAFFEEMINLKFAQRDYAAARELLEAKLVENPHDLSALRRLADIDLDSHRLAEVDARIKAMAVCGDQGKALASYFQVRRMLHNVATRNDPSLQEAAKIQAELVRARPNWAEAIALGGMIEQALGRSEQAIMSYQRAIALGDQRMAIYERLIALLESLNRTSEAARYLARMKAQAPLSQQLTVFESTLELRKNQVDEAIAIARNGVQRRPKDPGAHVWLARMLDRKNLLQEAEASFVQATQLAPTDVRTWNALCEFYIRLGDTAKASQALEQLKTKAEITDTDRDFLLAQHLEAMGETDRAAEHYEAAIKTAEDNPGVLLRAAHFFRRTDLAKALELAEKAYEADRSSQVVRRTYAALRAESGTERDWAALNELFLKDQNGATPEDDSRLKAILAARRGGAAGLQKAIETFTELVNRPGEKTDRDQFVLAQLHEQYSQYAPHAAAEKQSLTTAQQHFSKLTTSSASEPVFCIAHIEFLLRHKELGNVKEPLSRLERIIDRSTDVAPGLVAQYIRLCLAADEVTQAENKLSVLEKTHPNALFCIGLRVQVMSRQGQDDKIESYSDQAGIALLEKAQRAGEKISVCKGIGDLLASHNHLSTAEKWYRELYAAAPNRFEPLVEVLTQQGRVSDALAICQERNTGKTKLAAGLTTIAVLTASEPTEAESRQADALIDSVRQEFPSNQQLLAGISTLQVVRGDTDQAIAGFRSLVRKDSKDWTALNNLATLLGEKAEHRKEALDVIEKAISIAGNQPSLLDTRGTILFLEGRSDEAIRSLEPAVNSPSTDPRFKFHLALAYQGAGRKDDARTQLEQALQGQVHTQILTLKERKLLNELRSELEL